MYRCWCPVHLPSFLQVTQVTPKRLLLEGKVDGVSPDIKIARRTLNQIMALAEERPLVYLPSHDPESLFRLQQQSVIRRESKSALYPGTTSVVP
jgi:hypothetical protein